MIRAALLISGLFLIVIQLEGCETEQIKGDVVISRSEGPTEGPAWTSESETFRIRNGQCISLGFALIPGDGDLKVGRARAEASSIAGITHELEGRLRTISKLSEDQISNISFSAGEFLTSKEQKDYWEKIDHTEANGQHTETYKYYVETIVSEKNLEIATKKAVVLAENDASEEKISKEVGKAILSQNPSSLASPHWMPLFPDSSLVKKAERREPAAVASGSYTIQLSSFLIKKNAIVMIESLGHKGIHASAVPFELNGQKFFRVWMGRYRTKSEARLAYTKAQKIAGLTTSGYIQRMR